VPAPLTTTATAPSRLPSPGAASVVALFVALWMALIWSPPDAAMGDVVRILYVHVANAWLAYLAFVVVFVASIAYLWTKRPVFLPEQPSTGFTVAHTSDTDEMQRLCRVYEASDEEGRRLIRLFAELSVSDALAIPPSVES